MNDCKIAFLGAGNMALSLIGGLTTSGFDPQHIHVADSDPLRLTTLTKTYSVLTFDNNYKAIQSCDVIIAAVKPHQLQDLIKQIAPHWKTGTLLLSIAAGIRLDDLARWLNQPDPAIVRTMPNMPALIQAGATALYATSYVTPKQHELADLILRSVGLTIWVNDETQIDAVTALSGSGPAYFFFVMEAMEAAAIKLGLDAETAKLLCLQTAFGSAKMALESDETTVSLRARVTSPSGTTERAISELEDGGLSSLFENAMTAATLRSRELAKQLGEDHA
jgi:pyrroline-5-carboxylate reductase